MKSRVQRARDISCHGVNTEPNPDPLYLISPVTRCQLLNFQWARCKPKHTESVSSVNLVWHEASQSIQSQFQVLSPYAHCRCTDLDCNRVESGLCDECARQQGFATPWRAMEEQASGGADGLATTLRSHGEEQEV